MKRIFSIICAAFLLMAVPSFAVNTTVVQDGTITIVPDGATDWDSISEGLTNPKRIKSIQFNPSAANDILIVRAGSATGVIIFNSGPAGGTAPVIKYFPPDGKRSNLFIIAADLTLSVAANASIYIEYEN